MYNFNKDKQVIEIVNIHILVQSSIHMEMQPGDQEKLRRAENGRIRKDYQEQRCVIGD